MLSVYWVSLSSEQSVLPRTGINLYRRHLSLCDEASERTSAVVLVMMWRRCVE